VGALNFPWGKFSLCGTPKKVGQLGAAPKFFMSLGFAH